jgi:hypothetical protein
MPRETWELPADEAPWGHAGLPTVREAARAHPVFACFVGLFPAFMIGLLFQEIDDNRIAAAIAIPAAPVLWWLLLWLHIRGLIDFDD